MANAGTMGMGTPLTPEGMIAQWQHKTHALRINTHNFTVLLGITAQSVFRMSFALKKFANGERKYGQTERWQPRSKKSKGRHPLMTDTYNLMNSIKWKVSKNKVEIYTDPSEFVDNKKHPGFCFAQIHNDNNPQVRTGRVQYMPQRQFMGHSSFLFQKFKEIEPQIFKGFPI